jgi:hypothetical protein
MNPADLKTGVAANDSRRARGKTRTPRRNPALPAPFGWVFHLFALERPLRVPAMHTGEKEPRAFSVCTKNQ